MAVSNTSTPYPPAQGWHIFSHLIPAYELRISDRQRTGFSSSRTSFLPPTGRFSSFGSILGSSGLPPLYQTQSTLKGKCLKEVTQRYLGYSWDLPVRDVSLFLCQYLGLRQDHPEPQETSCSLRSWGDNRRTKSIPENKGWSSTSRRSPHGDVGLLYSTAVSIKALVGPGSRRGRS